MCAHLFIPDNITPGPCLPACVYHNWGEYFEKSTWISNVHWCWTHCDLSSSGPLSHQMWQYVMYWFLTIIYFRIHVCAGHNTHLKSSWKSLMTFKTQNFFLSTLNFLMFMILTRHILILSLAAFSKTLSCVTTDVSIQHKQHHPLFNSILLLVAFPQYWPVVGQKTLTTCLVRAHRVCCTQHYYYVSLIDQTPLSHSRHWFSHMTPHTNYQ